MPDRFRDGHYSPILVPDLMEPYGKVKYPSQEIGFDVPLGLSYGTSTRSGIDHVRKVDKINDAMRLGGMEVPERNLGENRGNQDRYFVDNEKRIYAVADGVSMSDEGDLAAEQALTVLSDFGKVPFRLETPVDTIEAAVARWFLEYFRQANKFIDEQALNDSVGAVEGVKNRSTTLVVARMYVDRNDRPQLAVGVIGDCRAYLLDEGGDIMRLTNDNVDQIDPAQEIDIRNEFLDNISLDDFNEMVRRYTATMGKSPEQISFDKMKMQHLEAWLRQRSMISQGLGLQKELLFDPEIHLGIELKRGMKIILCSDGIYDNLSRPDIQKIVVGAKDANRAAADLIAEAKKVAYSRSWRSKEDDMTALVVSVDDVIQGEMRFRQSSNFEETGEYRVE